MEDRQAPGGPAPALPRISPWSLSWLPDSVNGGLVGVGDQLQRGVCSGQWEHAGVQGLLGERVVGWIKFSRHHIHGYGGLQGTGQGARGAQGWLGLLWPSLLFLIPQAPKLLTLSCRRISSSILTASTLAAWVFLVRYLA